MKEFPDDFGSYIVTVFGSELSEPLIFAYDLLKFILDYRNTKHDSLTFLLNNDEIQCISSIGEAVQLPFPFKEHTKMCIVEIFTRDTLVQELFECDTVGETLEIKVKDIVEK